jgi:hypothetical protein
MRHRCRLPSCGVASVVVEDLGRPTFESRGALGRLEAVYEGDGVSVWGMPTAQVESG